MTACLTVAQLAVAVHVVAVVDQNAAEDQDVVAVVAEVVVAVGQHRPAENNFPEQPPKQLAELVR